MRDALQGIADKQPFTLVHVCPGGGGPKHCGRGAEVAKQPATLVAEVAERSNYRSYGRRGQANVP